MQLCAGYVISQACLGQSICLHMLIGISENENWEVLELHIQKLRMHHITHHKCAIGTEIFQPTYWWELGLFFLFQYMRPRCWIL